ncbi:MAG: UDP-N-acetylglucosamine 1-carboxyvinyltransferase MurA [Planctomycetota bacterium]
MQQFFQIHGGVPLSGTVHISGSKNASLPILAASLAIPGCSCIGNLPELADIQTMLALLSSVGAQITCSGQPSHPDLSPSTQVAIQPPQDPPGAADPLLVSRMRAGICLLGPLVARYGQAVIPLPGGCRIGPRPIDLHLTGLTALGADIHIADGFVHAVASKLHGTTINLAGPAGPTVTGTCNILTAATLATGTTRILNAAQEPEVAELATFLTSAGAHIHFPQPGTIEVHGVTALKPTQHTIRPDRIEAATFAIAAAITRGRVSIRQAPTTQMLSFIQWLHRTGVNLSQVPALDAGPPDDHHTLYVTHSGAIHPADVIAQPYPGIPTDLQAQMTALLALADGHSCVSDIVFPERFQHIPELLKFGANISRHSNSALICGVSQLKGAQVRATDLRASATLVIAALAAHGTSEIHDIHHLDRGYQRLEHKLRQLGAQIERISSK